MSSLADLVREHTDLAAADLSWLQLLLADWQILADLSFADLVLWVPDRDAGFWAAAQLRPTTGPTAYVEDVVGTFHERTGLLRDAMDDGRVVRAVQPETMSGIPISVEGVPVRRPGPEGGRVIAVIARVANRLNVRTPSRLELAYLQTASDLTQMIANGSFPYAAQRSEYADQLRVGDGFIRLEADGRVSYASPNALSVYRRIGLVGDLAGQHLADVTRSLVPAGHRPDEETLSAVLGARMPRETELGSTTASLIMRAVPLRPAGDLSGGLVLVRDVTDLRRRDRELLTKEATIREVHHRVKNNLQTVAALLRLQSRRIGPGEGRHALDEAVRRVGSIAVVHDLLSQTHVASVDLGDIVDRLLRTLGDVAGGQVRASRSGEFGLVPSEAATSLSMVLNELLHNAVEHGSDEHGVACVSVVGERYDGRLVIAVSDEGVGVPEGFDAAAGATLGLSIVRELLAELAGTVTVRRRASGGTCARVEIPL